MIILSRESLNRGNAVTIVVITSSKLAVRTGLPNCVPFRAGDFGLPRDCVAQGESIAPIPTAMLDLDTGPVGVLSDAAMRDVIRAVGFVLEADCEPD